MSEMSVRAVLWDADGVLQRNQEASWKLARLVVSQFPDALIGAPIDDKSTRAVCRRLGLGERMDDVLQVWSEFELREPSLSIVSRVQATGRPCYLATNQDSHRAAQMRRNRRYGQVFESAYYSCDIGVAKPSTAFFSHIATDLRLMPCELLFIDDQARNVDGALSAGLCAEQWTHTEGTIRLRSILESYAIDLDGG